MYYSLSSCTKMIGATPLFPVFVAQEENVKLSSIHVWEQVTGAPGSASEWQD